MRRYTLPNIRPNGLASTSSGRRRPPVSDTAAARFSFASTSDRSARLFMRTLTTPCSLSSIRTVFVSGILTSWRKIILSYRCIANTSLYNLVVKCESRQSLGFAPLSGKPGRPYSCASHPPSPKSRRGKGLPSVGYAICMMTHEPNDEAFSARHLCKCAGGLSDARRANRGAAALPDRQESLPFAGRAGGERRGREPEKSRRALDA